MGEVYRAIEEDQLGTYTREVAIKFNKNLSVRELNDRFRREVQTLCRLRTPHSLQVYGYGELKERGHMIAQFMIMELLEGLTLERRLAEGPLPWPEALMIFRQIASALSEAHQKGVIHRDLKPDNVMLLKTESDPDFVKLFDFGLSKDTMTPVQKKLSTSGVILGTLWYMSPEQARGETIDPRSDIFSLGVILYQMLNGSPPFPADNLFQLYQMHPAGPAPFDPHLPESLQLFVQHCLAHHPKDRFASVKECLVALEQWMGSPSSSTLPPLAKTPPAVHLPSAYAKTDQFPPYRDPILPTPSTGSTPPPEVYSTPSSPLIPPLSSSLSVPRKSRLTTFLLILLGIGVLFSATAALYYLRQARQTSRSYSQWIASPSRRPPEREQQPDGGPPAQMIALLPDRPLQQPERPSVSPAERPSAPPPRRSKPEQRPPLRPRSRKRYRRVLVLFKTHPSCQRLLLKGRSFSSSRSLSLTPGTYRLTCLSPRLRFRRTFSITLSSQKRRQIIEKRWRRLTIQKVFLRPWAYLYVDGFFIKNCDYGCVDLRLWSGKNKIVLKRPQGEQGQRIVVYRRTLHLSRSQKKLKIRWQRR